MQWVFFSLRPQLALSTSGCCRGEHSEGQVLNKEESEMIQFYEHFIKFQVKYMQIPVVEEDPEDDSVVIQ